MHRIYLIKTANDKCYVGYTSRSIHTRLKEHLKSSKTGRTKFYNCLRKHGLKSIELLAEFKEELRALKYEIDYINTHPGLLNTSSGGEGRSLMIKTIKREDGIVDYMVQPRRFKGNSYSPKRRVPSRQRRRRR